MPVLPEGSVTPFGIYLKIQMLKIQIFLLKKVIFILFQFSTELCISCFENNAVLTPQLDIPHTMNACARQPFSHCSGTDI